ncbi:MAG: CsgG/HfaB family protein, partial [Flavobacteriales bacterium]
MNFSRILTYLLLIALLSGCATSKSFYKKGAKLEEAGLMEEAAQFYLISLQKNRSNVEAKIGLKNTGQVVLSRYLSEFSQQKVFGNRREAIASWDKAMAYKDKVANLGVQLNVPSMYASDYEEIKNAHLNQLYEQGLAYMDEQNYSEAEKCFIEIKKLDKDYEDAHELADIAFAEPNSLDNEKYRDAYKKFNSVLNRLDNYKEASTKKAESLALGQFTLALLPFENSTRTNGLDIKISAYCLEALTSVNDPFLKVVDRENLTLIIEEQQLGLSGVMDEETAVSVGELIGAQAIVSGAILNYGESIGRPQRNSKVGYEQYKVKKLNKENNKYFYETKYRKTSYNEFVNRNLVTATFQYKVISLKTGEILASKIIEKEVEDAVRYASYDGELSNLYPGSERGVNTNRRAKSELTSMMSARQNVKSPEELSNDLFKQLSAQMTND